MRRSRGQIVLAILDLLTIQGRLKTQIVYLVNINFKMATSCLQTLVEEGLVAWDSRTRAWYITLAGKEAADHMRAVEAIL
jgi:predicted transcriptional regulator